ncbi:MAG TPA: DegT/DnrJ/EryC1/StrS family aminotransferase [Xanthobacteraceae bacterium]|nr:DegT/DnrJ/EryC1/StrS family aminotransferase [Xanthobacteraceae bacterium]
MTLALLGGTPVRAKPYPPHITIGAAEKRAVNRVLDSGILSDYEGSNNRWFMGGPEVRAFEEEWAAYFDCKHAVAVNSATSGLMAAVGAAGIGPGDEVITTPWTMSATATAIVVNNAVPIFCDIDPETFCMSPQALERKITPRTKAIMPIHIFGHPAAMDEIMAIARKHSLVVIEDAAQSVGIAYKGRMTGCLGHMGVHSLNNHKIIQTGEGGVIMTDDDDFAQRLRMIRNHAEAVVATGMPVKSLVNMVGWNYRLNEIEAAIGREQLKKLRSFLNARYELVAHLSQKLGRYDGLILPVTRPGCGHSYYRFHLRLDPARIKVPMARIVDALNAEGMDFYPGYVVINGYPMFQNLIAFGDKGCPFRCPHYQGGTPDYGMDTLPNVAHAMEWSFSCEIIRPPQTFADMNEIDRAFDKVWSNLDRL